LSEASTWSDIPDGARRLMKWSFVAGVVLMVVGWGYLESLFGSQHASPTVATHLSSEDVLPIFYLTGQGPPPYWLPYLLGTLILVISAVASTLYLSGHSAEGPGAARLGSWWVLAIIPSIWTISPTRSQVMSS